MSPPPCRQDEQTVVVRPSVGVALAPSLHGSGADEAVRRPPPHATRPPRTLEEWSAGLWGGFA